MTENRRPTSTAIAILLAKEATRNAGKPADQAHRHLSISEMHQLCGVTQRTLRHYEDLGLIQPERRGERRRFRFYGSNDVARMQFILRGKRFGFSLDQIRRWFWMMERGEISDQILDWRHALEQKIDLLEREKRLLEAAIDEARACRTEAIASLHTQKSRAQKRG